MKERLKKAHGQSCCKTCGLTNPLVLVYHHRISSQKNFGIAWAMQHNYSFNRILKEVQKCDLLCANCHSIFHKQSNHRLAQERLRRKIALMADIHQTKCLHCGFDNVAALTFHHREPSLKIFKITNNLLYSYSTLLEEAKKCDVLCANCHILLHLTDKSIFNSFTQLPAISPPLKTTCV